MAREWMDLLRILHGSYNAIVALAFMYQGWLGLKIRSERKTGGARNFDVVRRHRGRGPALALLGILGYVAGATLITIDKGHLFAFPRHHIAGAGIVLLLTVAFLISKKIRGLASPWRTRHFIAGVAMLCLYAAQIFLGLNILL
jgi:hypothetical protein